MTDHRDEAERGLRELTDRDNFGLTRADALEFTLGKLAEVAAHVVAHLRSLQPATATSEPSPAPDGDRTDEELRAFEQAAGLTPQGNYAGGSAIRRALYDLGRSDASRSSSAKVERPAHHDDCPGCVYTIAHIEQESEKRIAELEKECETAADAFEELCAACGGAANRSAALEWVELAKKRLDEAEKTIEAWRPVVEAAKAWGSMRDEEDGHAKTEALEAAVDALGGGT